MARVPYLDRKDVKPEHQDLLARNINLYRALVHSPDGLRSFSALGHFIRHTSRLDPRLRERGFGSWEGLTTPEIEERFGEAHRLWRDGNGPGAEDAEPFEAFSARIEDFLTDVLHEHPGEEVLVISHGGSIRAIHALATGLDYVRDHRLIPGVPNCVIARYTAEDGKLSPLD